MMNEKKAYDSTKPVGGAKGLPEVASPVQIRISQLNSCGEAFDQLLYNLDNAITILNGRLESVLNPNILGAKADVKKEINNDKKTIGCPLCAQLDSLIEFNNLNADKICAITKKIEDITSILDI